MPRCLPVQVTKRELGTSYLVGTGAVVGLVLAGELLVEGPRALPQVGIGFLPVVGLVAPVYWLERSKARDEQVWRVAECGSLALGAGVLSVIGLDLLGRALAPSVLPAVSTAGTVLLATVLATLAAAGVLVGLVRELQRTNRRRALRNAVLHRVLRHNLRNDMTVALCHLDELQAEVGPDGRETVDRVRNSIEGLVELTDQVRQMNVAAAEDDAATRTVDLVELVETGVERVRESHPGVTVETDLPDRAVAHLGAEFGLVLDNVAHSASGTGDGPTLYVSVTTDEDAVHLRIEDRDGSLPEADLSAMGTGPETDLQHGVGMELWLVYWLVDANGGDLAFETAGETSTIDIELDRATGGWLRRATNRSDGQSF